MDETHVEFILKTDKKCHNSTIKSSVNNKLRDMEIKLEQRRSKLRKIYEEESVNFSDELKKQQSKMEDILRETKRLKAIEIESLNELKRKEIVAEKLAQRTRENSEEQTLQVFMDNQIEVAVAQKYQIMEKNKIIQMDKELDKIWQGISKELLDIKRSEDERKRTENTINKKIYNKILHDQINDKIVVAKEEAYEGAKERAEIQKLVDKYKEDLKEELVQKEEKRKMLAKTKYENLIQSRELHKNRQKEEETLSKYFQLLNQYDPKDDILGLHEKKEQERLELTLFKDNIIKLRKVQNDQRILEEQIREKEAAELLEKQDKIKQFEHMAKDKLHKEVMKMRLEQMIAKQANK